MHSVAIITQSDASILLAASASDPTLFRLRLAVLASNYTSVAQLALNGDGGRATAAAAAAAGGGGSDHFHLSKKSRFL
jgi:hypothetical protein